jgi:hypothetical protein
MNNSNSFSRASIPLIVFVRELKYFLFKSIRFGLAALAFSGVTPSVFAAPADVDDVRALARLYSAAFDREPLVDGLNFWVDSFEGGQSLTAISGRFYLSPEFNKKYGPLDNTQYVEQLFRNVLGRDGLRTGIDFWVGKLDEGTARALVLAKFSDSPENVVKTTDTFANMRLENDQWTFSREETNNLIATSLAIQSPDARIGYPLTLALTIEAIESTKDVGVTFYAFDTDQPDARTYSLGGRTIAQVKPGSSAFAFTLDVPTEISRPGSYFIAVAIDAANSIAETNEDDNDTYFETTLSAKDLPNLFIKFMEPDRNAIVLDRKAWDYKEQISANGEIVSDAGGTITYGVKGVEQPMNVEAFATLRLIRDAGPTGPVTAFGITRSGDFLDVPLYLWNSDADRYNYAYGMDPKQQISTGSAEWLPIGRAGQSTLSSSEFDLRSAHLDFYFPGRLAEEIEIALRQLNVFLGGPIEPPPDLSAADIQALRSFLFGAKPADVSSELCLTIRPANARVIEDTTDDNQVCSPLALLLPPVELNPPPPPIPPPVPPIYNVPSDPIFLDTLYRAGWPGNYFGISVDFSAYSSIDTNGAIVGGEAEIPVTLFGNSFQLMGMEARAQLLPLSDRFLSDKEVKELERAFSMNVSIANQVIFVRNEPPGTLKQTLNLSWSVDYPKYLPPEPDDTPEEIKKRRPPIRAAIGPVPVEFRPKVTASIGVDFVVEIDSVKLSYSVEPFASAEGVLEASSNIVPFVKIEGAVTLIKIAQPHKSNVFINVLDNRHADGTSEIVFDNQFSVKNTIETLSGELNAVVELTGGKSCKKWGIFSFVCKVLPDISYKLNLFSWEGFSKSKDLKNERRIVDIITLPDKSVHYYQEI